MMTTTRSAENVGPSGRQRPCRKICCQACKLRIAVNMQRVPTPRDFQLLECPPSNLAVSICLSFVQMRQSNIYAELARTPSPKERERANLLAVSPLLWEDLQSVDRRSITHHYREQKMTHEILYLRMAIQEDLGFQKGGKRVLKSVILEIFQLEAQLLND